MKSEIPARLNALRASFEDSGIDALLVPSSDEFQSEYTPTWRCRREYLSGFSGSAGDLLVGKTEAWLFVDTRYHLQADVELRGSGITPLKLGQKDVLGLRAFLLKLAEAQPGFRLGLDPMVVSLLSARLLREKLEGAGAQVVELPKNPIDPLWEDRPIPPTPPLIPIPLSWSGLECKEKIALIRSDLREKGADALASVKLDQIAWLFNLRSKGEIAFNPLFEGLLYLDQEEVHLFISGSEARLPSGWSERPDSFQVHELEAYLPFVEARSSRVLVDANAVTAGIASALVRGGATLVEELSPIEKHKAIKTPAEREQMREANLKASIAKTKALLWLEEEVQAGTTVTENRFREKIESLYAEQEGYFELSFGTISATGPHSAIIHYGACDDTPLEEGHFFLIDSGAHFGGGTTDDTRSAAIQRADEEMRRVYTAVLRGHINAARQRFPKGTGGTALDAITRAPLWEEQLNYGHGTGHGVGALLCVHEGPQSIAERSRSPYGPQALRDGMVTSIEPGYYREGWGGVRLENLYLIVEEEEEIDGRIWLRFEPLSWIPFDPRLIDRSRLQAPELRWLDDYHARCLTLLKPHLSAAEMASLLSLLKS